MLTVLSFMIAGFAAGYLLRNKHIKDIISKLTTIAIVVLLFILGIVVGGDDMIFNNLAVLGGQALLIAVLATLGSLIAARLVGKIFFRKNER